jgi:hypothetical protein
MPALPTHLRLRLRMDSRRGVLRHHLAPSARRVIALEAYDRFVGLELSEMALDCCITMT